MIAYKKSKFQQYKLVPIEVGWCALLCSSTKLEMVSKFRACLKKGSEHFYTDIGLGGPVATRACREDLNGEFS